MLANLRIYKRPAKKTRKDEARQKARWLKVADEWLTLGERAGAYTNK